MDRALTYHVSNLVVGGLLGLVGVSAILDGSRSIAPLMAATGGLVLVLVAGHQLVLSDDPSGSVSGTLGVGATVLAAVFAVAGTLLQVI